MTGPQKRDWLETLKISMEIVGIVVASFWAYYTFRQEKVVIPASAPVNITMELGLKEVGGTSGKNKDEKSQEGTLSAIEMRVSARNPSSRSVYLHLSQWTAEGLKIADPMVIENDAFKQKILDSVIKEDWNFEERYSKREMQEMVAGGSLFPDKVLQPNESVMRTLIFYIPRGQFDVIDVNVEIETSAVANITVKKETNGDLVRYGPADSNGPPKQLAPDKDGNYEDRYKLQSAISRFQLSVASKR